MSFEFVEEQISLAIPTDGMTLKSGWKITPVYDPMVNITTITCQIMKYQDAVKLTLAFNLCTD